MINIENIQVNYVLNIELTVPASLYKSVRLQVRRQAHTLKKHKKLTLKAIYGKKRWNLLTNYERSLAGKIMRYLVENNIVPFEYSRNGCHSPIRYNLIDF